MWVTDQHLGGINCGPFLTEDKKLDLVYILVNISVIVILLTVCFRENASSFCF